MCTMFAGAKALCCVAKTVMHLSRIIHEMDIQEPEFTSEQVRSVLFTQDAGNQCESMFHLNRY